MSEPTPVLLSVLPHGEGLDLPAHATTASAGLDLRAAVPEAEPLTLRPGQFALVPTGLQIALPPGTEGQVRPRSGLAAKHGVTVLNSPGTIDSDYRGPLGVIVINLGDEPIRIAHGDRIAQAVVAPVVKARFELAESLSATSRGVGGFGSTGQG